jgi:cytochrome c peroxidase
MPNTKVRYIHGTVRLILASLVLSLADTAFAVDPQTGLQATSTAPPSLRSVSMPPVPGLTDGPSPIVVNKAAAIALGKAWFWDQTVGSDSMACASCHFQAGADSRIKNQVNPGTNSAGSPTALTFEPLASGASRSGPNYTLRKADFPFHQFVDPADTSSGQKYPPHGEALRDDVCSSSGTFSGEFIGPSSKKSRFEMCSRTATTPFAINGIATRHVEPRNSPTVINAIFNFRNFWDGRANNIFNGVNPFGLRDPEARVWVLQKNGTTIPQPFVLANASLASQAVGPPLSTAEMSCAGRTFPDIGRKILPLKPLSTQTVSRDDSVLGSMRQSTGIGLNGTYMQLVKQAFAPRYWTGTGDFGRPKDATQSPYTHIEANFSLFWGIALQMYQGTLVSDDSPYDRYRNGIDTALSARQKNGLSIFLGKGQCSSCHHGAEFTNASVNAQSENGPHGLVERMTMANGNPGLYDRGFYNIGVVPSGYDVGIGGEDPWGTPLSFTDQYKIYLATGVEPKDPFTVDPCSFSTPVDPSNCSTPPSATERGFVRGAFKVPTLRNVELTAPYMHDGSMGTLRQVMEFYNRGGNVSNPELHPDIRSLGLTSSEIDDLVLFMTSLTDDRVRYERAPFDHPALRIPNGHQGDENSVSSLKGKDNTVIAKDSLLDIPAVGKSGRAVPPQGFWSKLP